MSDSVKDCGDADSRRFDDVVQARSASLYKHETVALHYVVEIPEYVWCMDVGEGFARLAGGTASCD